MEFLCGCVEPLEEERLGGFGIGEVAPEGGHGHGDEQVRAEGVVRG